MLTNQFQHIKAAIFAVALTGLWLTGISRSMADYSNSTSASLPSPIYGVTVDSISNLPDIVNSLAGLSQKPTTRIVFDEFMPATYYNNATAQIHNVSYTMGEILDSYYVNQYTVQQYLDRTSEYLNTLGSKIDIWEIGNEINGEWLGDTTDVVQKMQGAYDLVKEHGGKTALTLYYNKDCWKYPTEEMFTWAQTNIPAYMKANLDYVFVSYYEDDCNNLQPDWPTVFNRLSTMFPNSKVGFGESGTIHETSKAEFINRYYKTVINNPNYVGGYFWWYFKQDMVPKSKPLWAVLDKAIADDKVSVAKADLQPIIDLLLQK